MWLVLCDGQGRSIEYDQLPSIVNVYSLRTGKSPLFWGKSTIGKLTQLWKITISFGVNQRSKWAIVNSELLVYWRVTCFRPLIIPGPWDAPSGSLVLSSNWAILEQSNKKRLDNPLKLNRFIHGDFSHGLQVIMTNLDQCQKLAS